jgi:hypothetical protein
MYIFEQYWFWMLVSFLTARLLYRARIEWLKMRVIVLEEELIEAKEREDDLNVKAGTHQPNWNINDWVEEDEIWDGISQKDRNEA